MQHKTKRNLVTMSKNPRFSLPDVIAICTLGRDIMAHKSGHSIYTSLKLHMDKDLVSHKPQQKYQQLVSCKIVTCAVCTTRTPKT